LTTGFDFSHGDYGASRDTDLWYVPTSINYDLGPWRFSASVPYVHIDGPGAVVAGDGGGVVVGPGTGVSTSASGLGDVVGAVSYLIRPSSPYIPFIELAARVKAPTANEDKGLGTGEFDTTLQ